MDEKLKAALVRRARSMIQEMGLERFMKWEYHSSPCGCMGPSEGEPLCSCRMRAQLEIHKTTILSEIDSIAALQLLRANIIKALR